MKKLKSLFLLVLCHLMLCQTTVDVITTDYGIETYNHQEHDKRD